MADADGALIRRFREAGDEAAFQEIVRRHGGMVLGVCRRVLPRDEDPEDAFQATFLVLATEAAKLRKVASVASWLHGVALRVSLKAKARAAARREHERRAAEMLSEDESREWLETRAVIDEEVRRLPERLRAPLVLCYFEDRTVEDAARELGWTDGEVRGRLAKARDVLHGRLARRGVAVGAAALAVLMTKNASAAVPPAYVASTVKAASGLVAGAAASTEGMTLAGEVVRAMAVAKAKLAALAAGAAAVVLAGALVVTGAVSGSDAAPDPLPGALARRGVRRGEGPRPAVEAAPASEAPLPARLPVRPQTGALDASPDAPPAPGAPGAEKIAADWGLGGPAARALADFVAARPGAAIEGVKLRTRRGRESAEVTIARGGLDCEVRIGADGAMLRVKEELDPADLPPAVLAAVEALSPGATIAEAEREEEGGRVRYDLKLDAGGEEVDLELGPDGQPVEEDAGDEDAGEEDAEEEDAGPDGDRDDDAPEGGDGGPAPADAPPAEAF